MTFTVLTWFWRQPGARIQYDTSHVAIWADMVRRHLTIPHRLVCVTNEALDLPSHIEVIAPPDDFAEVRIPSWGPERPQCLRRLSMFRPDAASTFGERFVSMDLDLVVGDRLDPLFEGKEDFRICEGTASNRPYNGSMMMLTAGKRATAFTDFTPKEAIKAGQRYFGSDQAWLAYKLPGELTWGAVDGVTFNGLPRTGNAPRRITFYAGGEKPWGRLFDPWVGQNYRRDARGRCLILGYASNVWDEVDAALKSGPFDGAILSPEAARHWPGKITAIADSDAKADKLAMMHGFTELVWCGRSEEAA